MKKIGELQVTDKSKLVLSIGKFKDRERIDLRMYVRPENGDKEIPTKKGIFFDSEWLPDFMKMIEKLKDK